MNLAFITKEEISYDEAPPSRILNLKKYLEKYHNIIVIGKKSPNNVREENVCAVPRLMDNFLGNQIFKLMVIATAFYLMFAKEIEAFVVREYYYVLLLYPFTKLFGKKIIYDMHCFRYKELIAEKNFKTHIVKPFEIISHKLANNILVISEPMRKDLAPKARSKSILLPNGVDIDYFRSIKNDKGIFRKYGIPEGKNIVGFVGNWMEWVDIPTLLESSKLYDPDTMLVIVGKQFLSASYSIKPENYPNAVFTGKVPHEDVAKLLKIMDVCVLPYKEAEVVKHLSVRKTLEYLAAGKPIIMSDLELNERKFLHQGKNVLLYRHEDSDDLARKISLLLRNKQLMKRMSENNLQLSRNFGWESIIAKSKLQELIPTYIPEASEKPQKVTIIIKALNEEQHIEKCIKSALKALEGIGGEIILVDSNSEDRTVEIAKKFPIKILQLANKRERCCGIGPQIGYLNSKYDHLYILDGDMEIDKDFIKKALPYFHNPKVAGVGGIINEKSTSLLFRVRIKEEVKDKPVETDSLGMGGLYRKSAIDDVGYFSNPYFYAYEEFHLAANLSKKNYKLIRIPVKMVDHYGDEVQSLQTLRNRWSSKYLQGSGQLLRASFANKSFLRTASALKIYIFMILLAIVGVAAFVTLLWTRSLFIYYAAMFMTLFIILAFKKKNLSQLIFSLISWTFQSAGMMRGLFLRPKRLDQFIPSIRVIKNG